MVYRPPYPWYIDPPTHGISTPLTMVYRPPTHGISTPQPMVFWPPCPWNIDPPTYGISNPLLWYYELLSFGRNEGGFNLPWGGSKYNDKKLTPGSKYHMENWTRCQNIIGISTPGSIYHGVQNTIWHRSIVLKTMDRSIVKQLEKEKNSNFNVENFVVMFIYWGTIMVYVINW